MTANAPNMPTTRNPTWPGNVNATGGSPASTQASWNRVSNCAKARPWLASGASRCTIESNASRPIDDEKLTTKASTMAVPSPPVTAANTPATAITPSAIVSISSSRMALRNLGATTLPAIDPNALAAAAMPNWASP